MQMEKCWWHCRLGCYLVDAVRHPANNASTCLIREMINQDLYWYRCWARIAQYAPSCFIPWPRTSSNMNGIKVSELNAPYFAATQATFPQAAIPITVLQNHNAVGLMSHSWMNKKVKRTQRQYLWYTIYYNKRYKNKQRKIRNTKIQCLHRHRHLASSSTARRSRRTLFIYFFVEKEVGMVAIRIRTFC